MEPLSCSPVPSNINPLQNNGFLFSIQKLPEVTFFCQNVTLPELSLPATGTTTPLVNIPFPGDKLDFSQLTVSFLIDSEMKNYVAVHDWLIGLGFPENHTQYANFINSRTNTLNRTPSLAAVSDATLNILGASSKTVRSIRFIGAFPTSLQSLQLETTNQDTRYLTANATFAYSYYTFD